MAINKKCNFFLSPPNNIPPYMAVSKTASTRAVHMKISLPLADLPLRRPIVSSSAEEAARFSSVPPAP